MKKFPRLTFLAVLCSFMFSCNNDKPIEESTANIDDFALLRTERTANQQYKRQDLISINRFSNMKSILNDDREL